MNHQALTDDIGPVNSPESVDLEVMVEPIHDQKRWEDLTACANFPHLPQSFAYGEAKRATGWRVTRYVFRAEGRLLAFGQFNEFRRFHITLITRLNRGPVFIAPETRTNVRAVYKAIREHWGLLRSGPLLIGPALLQNEENQLVLRELGFRPRRANGWNSGRIDLSPDEESIWLTFSSGFRNRYRSAEKAGAVLRITDDDVALEWLIDRHHSNMKNRGFRGVSGDFIRNLHHSAPDNALIFQVLDGDWPVAGMSVIRFGTRCEYHVGWFGEDGRKFNAGNFLMWNIIREMKLRGCSEFDVGGLASGSGFDKFKRSMRPREYQLAGEWLAV